jgi:hypothetical protein
MNCANWLISNKAAIKEHTKTSSALHALKISATVYSLLWSLAERGKSQSTRRITRWHKGTTRAKI